jgi:hypothetical protein
MPHPGNAGDLLRVRTHALSQCRHLGKRTKKSKFIYTKKSLVWLQCGGARPHAMRRARGFGTQKKDAEVPRACAVASCFCNRRVQCNY